MIHAPIHGSQLNLRAKLFKRFTATEEQPDTANMIKQSGEYYKTFWSFAYVEAADLDENGFISQKGMLVDDTILTIKLNWRLIPKFAAVDEPEAEDLVFVRGELWAITAVRRKRLGMLKDMAVLYLSLKRVRK